MKEEAALKYIRSKLLDEFGSIQKAAVKFDKTPQALNLALIGKQKEIPSYLLRHCGLEKIDDYVKVKK